MSRLSLEKINRFILDLWGYAKADLARVTLCISSHLVRVDSGKVKLYKDSWLAESLDLGPYASLPVAAREGVIETNRHPDWCHILCDFPCAEVGLNV